MATRAARRTAMVAETRTTTRVLVAIAVVFLHIAGCIRPVHGQNAPPSTTRRDKMHRLFFRTSQDVVLPVTSLEWGVPDRWSFTARYVHMFDKASVRDHKRSLNNLTVTLSPGTSGGRFGIGYENVYDFKKGADGSGKGLGLTLLSEARVVLLRTWGTPIATQSGRTFAGGELRTSVFGFLNVGIGYYAPLSDTRNGATSFWGLHAGVGI